MNKLDFHGTNGSPSLPFSIQYSLAVVAVTITTFFAEKLCNLPNKFRLKTNFKTLRARVGFSIFYKLDEVEISGKFKFSPKKGWKRLCCLKFLDGAKKG